MRAAAGLPSNFLTPLSRLRRAYAAHPPGGSAVTGTHVTPAVGFLERDFESADHLDAELALNAGEVAGAFVLSLTQLQDPALVGSTDLGPRGRIPVYRGGPAPVWGLTAYILSHVLDEVLLPTRPAGEEPE